MKKQKAHINQIILVGVTTKTNNKNEMNPQTAKIGALVGTYWGKQLANNIKHRTNPGITYAVYTDYASDEYSDYTYFIGEAVNSVQDQDFSQFKTLTIPAGNYQKFTTEPGKIPDVIIQAWQTIWKMNEKDFGGKRAYLADFELYDQRAADPTHAVLDIYIRIK